jgi:hypothetical protein
MRVMPRHGLTHEHSILRFLPPVVQFLGYARSALSDEALRDKLRSALPKGDPKKVGSRLWA